MLPKFIKPENIVTIEFHQDRPKANGCMWGGSAKVEINNVHLVLQLWHHGGDNETQESLLPHYRIKSVNGKDAYWSCLWDNEQLWQHIVGWFGFSENVKSLKSEIPNSNPYVDFRMLPQDKLAKLGFIKLV